VKDIIVEFVGHIKKDQVGAWVTDAVWSPNRLYEKARKHARSRAHLMNVARINAISEMSNENVLDLQIAYVNRQTEAQQTSTKSAMKMLYFLFKREIPHTLNFRTMVSTISQCGEQGRSMTEQIRQAGKHHLSPKSATGFLQDLVKLSLTGCVLHYQQFRNSP
jgi:predicted secreted protein